MSLSQSRISFWKYVLSLGVIFTAVFAPEADSEGIEAKLILRSPAFEHEAVIPDRYTCRGENIFPALLIEQVPENTKSLALIIVDSTVPMAIWVHGVIYNIPPDTRQIEENKIPGVLGINTMGNQAYSGPCPPGKGKQYSFRLFALDSLLPETEPLKKKHVLAAMENHILAYAELNGNLTPPVIENSIPTPAIP